VVGFTALAPVPAILEAHVAAVEPSQAAKTPTALPDPIHQFPLLLENLFSADLSGDGLDAHPDARIPNSTPKAPLAPMSVSVRPRLAAVPSEERRFVATHVRAGQSALVLPLPISIPLGSSPEVTVPENASAAGNKPDPAAGEPGLPPGAPLTAKPSDRVPAEALDLPAEDQPPLPAASSLLPPESMAADAAAMNLRSPVAPIESQPERAQIITAQTLRGNVPVQRQGADISITTKKAAPTTNPQATAEKPAGIDEPPTPSPDPVVAPLQFDLPPAPARTPAAEKPSSDESSTAPIPLTFPIGASVLSLRRPSHRDAAPPPPTTQPASLNSGMFENRTPLALSARLVPLETATNEPALSTEPAKPARHREIPPAVRGSFQRNSEKLQATAEAPPPAAPAESSSEESAADPADRAATPAAARHREARSQPEPGRDDGAASAAPAPASESRATAHEQPGIVVPTVQSSARPVPAGVSAPAAESARAAASPLPIEPARIPASAHDIKLEVATGERRVEVRLVERAGEVHLAVRTPDQRLSGALRDNLPELAARLEGAGYRTAAAAETTADSRRGLPHPAAAPQSQSQSDGRQRQRDGDPPPEQQNLEQRHRKQKGNDFAWFMSSLR
jgi:hypothetical protein